MKDETMVLPPPLINSIAVTIDGIRTKKAYYAKQTTEQHVLLVGVAWAELIGRAPSHHSTSLHVSLTNSAKQCNSLDIAKSLALNICRVYMYSRLGCMCLYSVTSDYKHTHYLSLLHTHTSINHHTTFIVRCNLS